MHLSLSHGDFALLPTWQICTQTRTELQSVAMKTLGPILQANTFLVSEHSVVIFALLRANAHILQHSNKPDRYIITNITYSGSLIHLHKYALLLTKSFLPATHILENFLFQSQLCVLTLIRCPFQHLVTVVARKRPQSFCIKYRWQVTSEHAYTLCPPRSDWANYATVQSELVNVSENEITVNSSGNTPSQFFHLDKTLWTNPALISVRELISIINDTKSLRRRMNCRRFSKSPRKRPISQQHQTTRNSARSYWASQQ